MQELVQLLEFLAEAFRCHVSHFQCLTVLKHLKWCTWHRKASAKNSRKLNKFLHSEVNLLIQHSQQYKNHGRCQQPQCCSTASTGSNVVVYFKIPYFIGCSQISTLKIKAFLNDLMLTYYNALQMVKNLFWTGIYL